MVYPYNCSSGLIVVAHTAERLNIAAAWSLTAAATGFHPSRGPENAELTSSYVKAAGAPLAGGLRLAYAGGTGDWKCHSFAQSH